MTEAQPITAQPPLTGGCLCGSVRYRITATPRITCHCHCRLCRKASAAPFVTWSSVPVDALTWTTGAPKTYPSSSRAERQFCADCGTPLTFRLIVPGDEIDITSASLDHPERVRPTAHIWLMSHIPWGPLPEDGLARHDGEFPDPAP